MKGIDIGEVARRSGLPASRARHRRSLSKPRASNRYPFGGPSTLRRATETATFVAKRGHPSTENDRTPPAPALNSAWSRHAHNGATAQAVSITQRRWAWSLQPAP
jgi:hypothetical protein